MLNLLNKIDGALASFRLAMVTENTSLVDSAAAEIKELLSAVASHADAKKYSAEAAKFGQELPKKIEEFVSSAKSNAKDKASKALDELTKIMGEFRPVVEGQPTDRNHI